MWQFMPFAGSYGLTRNGWLDERFDPEKSSIAYAKYMKSLYDQFGDWYLAMAAYDWGPGNIQRSVMRTGYADYWELYRRNELPQETKNYVPASLRQSSWLRTRSSTGWKAWFPMNRLSRHCDGELLSRSAAGGRCDGRLITEIVDLNPSLLRMSTPSDMDFDLHLPAGMRDVYLKRIEKIPMDKRSSWRFHLVRADESLDGIASSFHLRPSEIATANGLDANAPIAPGDELVVPLATTVRQSVLCITLRARATLWLPCAPIQCFGGRTATLEPSVVEYDPTGPYTRSQ